VDRLRAPPLPLFAVTSLAIHLVTFGVLQRAGSPRPPTFEPRSRGLSGDTLEVDPPSDSAPEPGDDTAHEAEPERRPSPEDRGLGRTATVAARERRAPSPAGGPAHPALPGLFGAVGTRAATDLATTLTRAFPQAASADPTWFQAPYGGAGAADLTLVLDEEGQISNTSIAGAPSVALRRGIERTLSLLLARPFTAHAPVTRLRVTARVSRDDVHDGLHGDVFALSGGSFAGDVGSAFFALPPRDGSPGRRVDVEIRLLP
jgi:hypothetical protein